ncbi:26S proteasome non-ATPase regulatory subunit 11 [Smittium culicis]|uniref:26S proteasome non-ATPase regulatory subunit 11 n=1 Tax=Smittium culicis TaxID=133412 RepID=A0A1R1XLT3_9FUNG|nr:26S proteasome non-ATPase regulatory subunit 11 [Smittium culicis]
MEALLNQAILLVDDQPDQAIPIFDTVFSSPEVQVLVDRFSNIPGSEEVQINICKDSIQWARSENRNYLLQALEKKLSSLYFDSKKYSLALELVEKLLYDLKKVDDKMELVEVHLTEAKIYHVLCNISKSKAALTSARTSANSIYTPPPLQAALDLYSGILHCEEKDYKTAYSYFFETLEGLTSYFVPQPSTSSKVEVQNSSAPNYQSFLHSQDKIRLSKSLEERQEQALIYMLLCKIMLLTPEEAPSLIGIGKSASKFRNSPFVVAMLSVANAQKLRSLFDFEKALADNRKLINSDPLVRAHLASLYDTLLGQNLLRIIEPYSTVEISHIAKLINLPVSIVESKLSQMILDNKLSGILDHGNGCLIIFNDMDNDQLYDSSLSIIKNMNLVVDSLYEKASLLN